MEREKQGKDNNHIPQVQIRLKSKYGNASIGNLFHLSKESGVRRPFLLLKYDKCDNPKIKMRKKKFFNPDDDGDAIIKRKIISSFIFFNWL